VTKEMLVDMVTTPIAKDYVLVYFRNERCNFINFTSLDEAKRVNSDLKGIIIEGKYVSHYKGKDDK